MTENALVSYLRQLPPIRPVRQTFRDSAVIYGLAATVQTGSMMLSGGHDSNWLRLAYGALATANVLATSLLSMYGRRQTYTDLRDLQAGVPADDIVRRAEELKKQDPIKRGFNWVASNTFDINSKVSYGVCGLMIASGLTHGAWGEVATGLWMMWAYTEALRAERYKSAGTQQQKKEPSKLFARAARPLRTLREMSPLMTSSLIGFGRQTPLFVDAAIRGDGFQMVQALWTIPMYFFKSDTTKDAIGRANGSLLSQPPERGAEIAQVLFNGRVRAPVKAVLRKLAGIPKNPV